LALTSEGTQLGFVASDPAGRKGLWLRPLSALAARAAAGINGAASLFWSLDGKSIAFFAGGKLKRLDLPGGAAVPLCDVPEEIGLAETWGSGGEILFASVVGEVISRVSTTGGAPGLLLPWSSSWADPCRSFMREAPARLLRFLAVRETGTVEQRNESRAASSTGSRSIRAPDGVSPPSTSRLPDLE
jgi:hypothetical protein